MSTVVEGPIEAAPSALVLRRAFDAEVFKRMMELLARRWTLEIFAELSSGPLRRTHLSGRINGCSEKMLTERLRELEAAGLVTRDYLGGTPPRVDYGLSERGHALTRRLGGFAWWLLRDIPADEWSCKAQASGKS